MELEIKKNQTLLVRGPARITLLKGVIEIFGRVIEKKELDGHTEEINYNSIIVPNGKQFPFFARETSLINSFPELTQDFFEIIDNNSIPQQWEEAKDELINFIKKRKPDQKSIIILLLGISGGKTSLSKYLANYFIRENLKGVYFDMDMGQQALFIPVCISASKIEKEILYINDLKPEKIKFIGSTFPKGNLKFIVSKYCKDLIDDYIKENEKIDFFIIDHDSWILNDPGIVYKSFFIKTVKPNVIVALYNKEIKEFDQILEKAPEECKIIKIEEENKHYFTRDKETRGFHRQSLFANAFSSFQKLTIHLNDIKFVKMDYDEKSDQIIEVDLDLKNLITLPYHYTIVALLTEKSELINIALLFSVNLEKHLILLYTDITYKQQTKIKKIQMGQLRLSTKGNNQGILFI